MNDEKVMLTIESDQFRRLWQVLELLETLLWEVRHTNDEEEELETSEH